MNDNAGLFALTHEMDLSTAEMIHIFHYYSANTPDHMTAKEHGTLTRKAYGS